MVLVLPNEGWSEIQEHLKAAAMQAAAGVARAAEWASSVVR